MKRRKFPFRLIIALIVALSVFVFWASTNVAHSQDSTSIRLETVTGFESIETYVLIAGEFEQETSAIEGKIIFDNRVLRFTGITAGDKGGIVIPKHTPWAGVSSQDSVQFSFATAQSFRASDSLLVIRFLPAQPGTAFIAMQNLVFNERGNDGVTWVRSTAEIYPMNLHPDFGGGGIDPDSVASTVNLRYMLRDAAGDVSCDGLLSAYDAATILRFIVGLEPGFASADPTECPTPIVVELQDK